MTFSLHYHCSVKCALNVIQKINQTFNIATQYESLTGDTQKILSDKSNSAASVLMSAMEVLKPETLDAPPGAVWDYHESAYRMPVDLDGA